MRRRQHKGARRKSQPDSHPVGRVRIIGGRWRGSKLTVPELEGLRPSGDRCRETLFNWLQGRLPGAACLDLFAGTGVLGLEALSRGAASLVLVERNPRALEALADSLERLAVDTAELVRGDGLAWLESCDRDFDLVFLDPPFGLGLQQRALEAVAPRLRPGGRVYVESPAADELLAPPGLEREKQKRLGGVDMVLLRKQSAES